MRTNYCQGKKWLYLICVVYIIVPLNAIFRTATIWTPVLVGIHRYIVVCKPLQAARICTVGNARRHFVCVLLLSFALNFPEFLRFHVIGVAVNATGHNVTYTATRTHMGSSPWFKIGYDKVCRTAIINYAIPVVWLVFVTVRLLQSLHSSRRRRMELSEGQRQGQTDRRAEWMVVVVLIVFLICHTSLPMSETLGYLNVVKRGSSVCDGFYFIMFKICYLMIYFNSSVNCIIYLTFNRNFRLMLCPGRRSVTNQPDNN